MKVLVCISHVPDTTAKVSFTNKNTEFNSFGISYILNPYDEIALAKAVELCQGGNGSIAIIHVGEATGEPSIRKALAIGADEAIRINAKPKDALFTAQQIAEYVKNHPFDLILCGKESIDYNGAQVPAMIGELLNIPSVSVTKKLTIEQNKASIEREIDGGVELLESPLPIVIACTEGLAEPRLPNIRGIMSAKTKPLKIIEPVSFPSTIQEMGYQTPPPRDRVKMIDPEHPELLIEALHKEAKVI